MKQVLEEQTLAITVQVVVKPRFIMYECACRNAQGCLSIRVIMFFEVFFQWQFIAVIKKNDFLKRRFILPQRQAA
jgi:hypothetical protein